MGAQGYNWATLPLGDINTEAWSSAGFFGGGQGLSWVMEPRKGGRRRRRRRRQIMKFLIRDVSIILLLPVKIFSSAPCSHTLSSYVHPLV
jgi:hypothetical protein